MIEDVVVIDAVAHALDLRPEELEQPGGLRVVPRVRLLRHARCAARGAAVGPRARGFDTLLEDTDVVESVIFRESWTDACFYHEIPMYGMFKGGLAKLENGIELRERHPDRVRLYGGVSPFEPGAVEKVDQLIEEHGVNALKLYPADLYESDVAPYGALRQYKMDDPDLIYPILERARHHGIVVMIHKAIPLGPVPMEVFKPDDLDAAFMAYPDLPIEIVHGGFAFLGRDRPAGRALPERLRHARGDGEPAGPGAEQLISPRCWRWAPRTGSCGRPVPRSRIPSRA